VITNLNYVNCRTLGDKQGEGKASGNLGNAHKALCNFAEAIKCCERHLELARNVGDKLGETRALYNLANCYHAKGKFVARGTPGTTSATDGHSELLSGFDPGEFPENASGCFRRAARFYGYSNWLL